MTENPYDDPQTRRYVGPDAPVTQGTQFPDPDADPHHEPDLDPTAPLTEPETPDHDPDAPRIDPDETEPEPVGRQKQQSPRDPMLEGRYDEALQRENAETSLDQPSESIT